MPSSRPRSNPDPSSERRGVHPHRILFAVVFMIATVAVLTFALLYVWRELPGSPVAPPVSPVPPPIPAASAIPTSTAPIAAPSGPVRERPAGMMCDELNYICVNNSYQNMVLDNPWMVTGTVVGNSLGLGVDLYSSGGEKVEAESHEVAGPDPFEWTSLVWKPFGSTTGTLDFYAWYAKNEFRHLRLSVQSPKGWMKVKIFVPTNEGRDCSLMKVQTIEIPKTYKPIAASINILLWEASNAVGESEQSFPTHIPVDTKLNSAVLSNGVLKLEFSKELENNGGGSCNVISIRSQIEKTAMQFGNVSAVEISVPGKTAAETLQP